MKTTLSVEITLKHLGVDQTPHSKPDTYLSHHSSTNANYLAIYIGS